MHARSYLINAYSSVLIDKKLDGISSNHTQTVADGLRIVKGRAFHLRRETENSSWSFYLGTDTRLLNSDDGWILGYFATE